MAATLGRAKIFGAACPNGFEVGRQITLNSLAGHPTSEPFGPGEIFFEWLQIARAGTFYPKFFKNHRDG